MILDRSRSTRGWQGRTKRTRGRFDGLPGSSSTILTELRTSLAEECEWVSRMRRGSNRNRLENQARSLLRELEAEERSCLGDSVSRRSLA